MQVCEVDDIDAADLPDGQDAIWDIVVGNDDQKPNPAAPIFSLVIRAAVICPKTSS